MQGIVDILTRFALAGCGVVAAAVMLAAGLVAFAPRSVCEPFRCIADFAVRRPFAAIVMAILLVLGPVRDAVTKVTNAPLRGASVELGVENGKWKVENGGVVAVGDSTILHSTFSTLHSFRLESETTNETYLYVMPSNGVRYSNWWIRGAYEDVFRLDLGGLLFPLGTNLCDSLWVYTWGMAGARLGDASNRVVATGVPMSAVPQVSRFWDAPTTNGSHLLTWENFFLNRDTNAPVSAQLELMPSGDFIARSNLVERLYRRVNPDDWDDDGIPNEEDDDPLAYDGDNFGPHQTLPEGANSNAYCWVDLVVPDANALVTFTGDGYSALPDPAFIAKAGATNRVILLIGKTYQVSSRVPIFCIGQSSGEIDVDQVSSTEIQIVWPVEIECVGMRSGASFTMTVVPDCLGGGFTWTNSCCTVVSLGGWSYSVSCAENCFCTGGGTLGYYGYEAYRLPAYGGSCGCWREGEISYGPDDEWHPAGISVSFSKDAVIFEDRYENSPGVWVERCSTKVELTCVAHGGPNGGCATFLITGGNRLVSTGGLALPVIRNVPADTHMSFKVQYEGRLASFAVDDIVVNAYFDDNDSEEERKSAEATLTSVRVEVLRLVEAPENSCSYRHKFGVCEDFFCNHRPEAADVSVGLGALTAGDRTAKYRCPLYAVENPLSVSYGGASYTPKISVVEPNGIQVRNPVVIPYITSSGRAGWVGLKQDFYVLPMDVSFANIAMQEVPCMAGTHSGYFLNPAFSVIWCHSTNNGAGVWNTIDALTNRMGEGDIARITMELLRVDGSGNLTDNPAYGWADGEITWSVPFGWGMKPANIDVLQTTVLHKQFDPNAGHRFLIVPDGTVSVRKFGNEATRDIQGHLFLNGVPCQ